MFNSVMFFCFVLLLIPRETRANALVFVFGFAAYQFIGIADSFLLYILSFITSEDTTFYHVLSASIIYGILRKLNIKNNYISYVAIILVLLITVNAIGWIMYQSYVDPFYYNLTSNFLILNTLAIMTWSVPGGRDSIKSWHSIMVHRINSKSDPMQIKQRKKEGISR